MIAETRFAKSFASSWRSLTPTLELFVRKANLHLVERNWTPVASATAPERRALVNRVSFEVLKEANRSADLPTAGKPISADYVAIQRAEFQLMGQNVIGKDEIAEVQALAFRMSSSLYASDLSGVSLEPRFKGCGIINSCDGDAVAGDKELIELKDGDRTVRSYDFRQLSIYAALMFNETGVLAPALRIINSRRGTFLRVEIEEFAREAAGQSAVDLFSEIVRVITDASIRDY